MEDLGRHLLRDFSEVEQNFRTLDRAIRAKIARLDGSRGQVLGAVFSESDEIAQSEQVRSFTAFFEFLMSSERRDELEGLLDYLYSLRTSRTGFWPGFSRASSMPATKS